MENQVLYQYGKIELEQFAMFPENYSKDAQGIDFETEVQFSLDKEQSVLSCTIIANMYNGDKQLIKAELKSLFNIKPESISELKKDGRIVFAPTILIQFASLCYGSMRGVIFAKTMNTPLCDFVIPPIFFGNIIDKPFVVE
jgi:hypothetical protein